MREVEIELAIGDVIRIGDRYLTIVDIENGEVCFRVDPVEEYAAYHGALPPGK